MYLWNTQAFQNLFVQFTGVCIGNNQTISDASVSLDAVLCKYVGYTQTFFQMAGLPRCFAATYMGNTESLSDGSDYPDD